MIHACLSFADRQPFLLASHQSLQFSTHRLSPLKSGVQTRGNKSHLEKLDWLPFSFKALEPLNLDIGSNGSITAILKRHSVVLEESSYKSPEKLEVPQKNLDSLSQGTELPTYRCSLPRAASVTTYHIRMAASHLQPEFHILGASGALHFKGAHQAHLNA